MDPDSPCHRYYRAMHGRWEARYSMQLTDAAALRSDPMGAFDRLQARSLLNLPRLVGPLLLRTTVDYHGGAATGEVVHTTQVSKWGVPLFESLDLFTLHDDGRSLSIGGTQRSPSWFPPMPQVGSAVAKDDATGAVYDLQWFGGRLHQETTVVPAGLRIVQVCAWGRAEFTLVRTDARESDRS